ncbi:hypothetical protein DSECCO2_419750 [anaerobic digester metagenome]
MFSADAGKDLLDPDLGVGLPDLLDRLPDMAGVENPQVIRSDHDPLVDQPSREVSVGLGIAFIGQDIDERSVAVEENPCYRWIAQRHASASSKSQSRSAARQGNRAIRRYPRAMKKGRTAV